jgi:signal transduction histidine kinase/CheY-like chemotaxis protein
MTGSGAPGRGRLKVGHLIALLIFITIGIFAAMMQLFATLYRSQNAVAWSVREDAMWAAFQADREVGRLIEALRIAQHTPIQANIDAALLRYDLLYSRGLLLERDSFAIKFNDTSPVAQAAQETQEAIFGLEALIDSIGDRASSFALVSVRLIDAATRAQALSGNLVVVTNSALNDARVAERAEVARTNLGLMISAILVAVLFVSIVALQMVQLAQLGRSRREIEALSERNALNAERAEASSQAKSMFLATMSHEIRTPLNGLIGTAELMADDELTPAQADNLATIRKSGELLLDVINDILDFSKMEAGRLIMTPAPCRVDHLVGEVATVMGQRARQAGLNLTVSNPSLRVTTDASRVRQVLVNLVGNAIKFTPQGNVSIGVTRVGPDRLRFDVKDTGIGITEEGLSNLFKDFSQVDGSASRAFTGTGLGLAISKRIVEGLGGRIGVKSIHGIGSHFWFEIPVIDAEEVQPDVPAAPDGPIVPAQVLSGTVLVAEDNDINRKVATGLLTRMGLVPRIARNGAEALDMCAVEAFDLVLMDYQMPVMNGLDATRAIRARGIDVPIVGLTANAFVEDREACIAAGMNDFIAKPITREKLSRALARFCQMDTAPAPVTLPPPSAMTAQDIDRGQFDALIDELGPEIVADLLFSFRADALRLLQEIATAASANDPRALDEGLHALKGVAQTVGLVGLASTTQSLRHGNLPKPHDLALLRDGADTGLAALTALLQAREGQALLRTAS